MKIAFSGSHGTGKTFSAYNKVVELKLQNKNKSICILNELARESPFPINRETTENSQLWIFLNQISEELEMETKYDIIVCDRTVVDVLAYSEYRGFDRLVKMLYPLAKEWIQTYEQIYFNQIRTNQHNYVDNVRDTDEDFRNNIEDIMVKYYNEFYGSNLIKRLIFN